MTRSTQINSEIQHLKDRITGFLDQIRKYGIKTSMVQTLEQIYEWLDHDAGYWLNLNVFGALTTEKFLAEGRSSPLKWRQFYSILLVVEYLRNVAIFFPILYTWWELSRATHAYGVLLTQQPHLRGENLLFLWQSGALLQAGVGSPSPFNIVALIDVLIILAIILMSLMINFFRDYQDHHRETILGNLAIELGEITWEVNRIFMLKRRQFFENVEERTLSLLNGLETFVEELEDQYKDVLERTAQQAVQLVEGVKDQVNILANQNLELASKQKTYLDNLTVKIDQLLLKISKEQDELMTKMVEVGDSYQHQWEQIIDQWKEELDKLTLASEKMYAQFSEARNLFGVLRENLKDFQKVTQQLVPVLEKTQENIAGTVNSLNKNQVRLSESLQSLEGSLQSVELICLEWSKEMEKALDGLRQIDQTQAEKLRILQDIYANDQQSKELFRHQTVQTIELIEALRSSITQSQSVESGNGFEGGHEQPN